MDGRIQFQKQVTCVVLILQYKSVTRAEAPTTTADRATRVYSASIVYIIAISTVHIHIHLALL